jgi:hypothetical protein
MSNSTRRSPLRFLLTVMVLAAWFVGSGNRETGEAQFGPTPSPRLTATVQLSNIHAVTLVGTPTSTPSPTPMPTPTLFIPAPLFDASLDIWASPVDIPLELEIPALEINAPVVGVGLTSWNVMDAPESSVNSPLWQTAFWYRGSSIPGEVGTATIGGHITDPLGKPGVFRYLSNLNVGDVIIIHDKRNSLDVRFIVNEVKVISVKEALEPEIMALIYGGGPVVGDLPQPSLDGLAHLTLITCATNRVTRHFDDRTLIFATRLD